MTIPKPDNLNFSATEVFRKEFHGYQKMTDSDYLEHSLLFGVLDDFLKTKRKPLRILDIGCGDAGNVSKIFARNPSIVASYTGVDMSESAVESARSFMRAALGSDKPVFFHVSDMLGYLENARGVYDVVLAAFAVHHLTSEDKIKTLKEIHRCLEPGEGVFIMVDPFRRPGESLKEYRTRACEVGETWISMGSEQRTNFINHMREYDIMEDEQFFEANSREAGFKGLDVLCRGQKGLQSCISALRA